MEDEDLQPSNCWVAKILEIRAVDEIHVYARVYWMYFPDELPVNTHDNGKLVSGRQPYHGQNELIASNHSKLTLARRSIEWLCITNRIIKWISSMS